MFSNEISENNFCLAKVTPWYQTRWYQPKSAKHLGVHKQNTWGKLRNLTFLQGPSGIYPIAM